MKLEVGMYARFDYHRVTVPIQIGKITKVYYEEPENSYHYLTDTGLVIGEDNLVKEPSFNIIDLIEVGDYVNGKLVEDVFEKTTYADKSIKLKGSGDYWYDIHIKSILTKESFASMEYKVGE